MLTWYLDFVMQHLNKSILASLKYWQQDVRISILSPVLLFKHKGVVCCFTIKKFYCLVKQHKITLVPLCDSVIGNVKLLGRFVWKKPKLCSYDNLIPPRIKIRALKSLEMNNSTIFSFALSRIITFTCEYYFYDWVY